LVKAGFDQETLEKDSLHMLVGATALLHYHIIITSLLLITLLFSQSLFFAETLMQSFPALRIGKALLRIDWAKQGEQNACSWMC